ncbi:hypothetical protein LINGRAHAP2_LOCUS10271 [Linum grandiflorum]
MNFNTIEELNTRPAIWTLRVRVSREWVAKNLKNTVLHKNFVLIDEKLIDCMFSELMFGVVLAEFAFCNFSILILVWGQLMAVLNNIVANNREKSLAIIVTSVFVRKFKS